jgi:hypothetical protein
MQGGGGGDVILTPLREEVVTSFKGVEEVLKRGEGNRSRTCRIGGYNIRLTKLLTFIMCL